MPVAKQRWSCGVICTSLSDLPSFGELVGWFPTLSDGNELLRDDVSSQVVSLGLSLSSARLAGAVEAHLLSTFI